MGKRLVTAGRTGGGRLRLAGGDPTRLAAGLRDALAAPRRVWVFAGVLAVGCALVWAVAVRSLGAPAFIAAPLLRWWELALVFYLAEAFVVHLQFRKQTHTLSLTEIGLVFGLLLASPASLLAGQLAGTLVALVVNRWRSQRQLVKLTFNLAELPLCSGIALLLFRALAAPGDPAPLLWALALLACAVAHVAGVLLVSAVIAIAEERFRAPQLLRTLAVSTVGALATASLGLAVVELLAVRPLAAALLVFPIVACAYFFRAYMEQREQREQVEFLYESMRATQGAPEFGLAVGQLLVSARRLLRAEYAEILLLPSAEGEGPLRSVSGSDGELLMHPEERLAPEDAAALGRVAAAGAATLLMRRRAGHPLDGFLRLRGLEDAIVGPLQGEHRTFGLLVVGERAGDVATFGEADVELFETFAGHASILLENGRLEH
ncbi:MAG TPA: GAF domain-containing protein, partial [Gaiellaceae bacterium]|nr:GAF domain-containing protein [Gaiellaceae bacterium]